MLIILGSIVLAVAIAAPVDVTETAVPEKTSTAQPFNHALHDVKEAVDKLGYVGASNGALVELFDWDRDLDDVAKYHKMLEWGRKWNIAFVETLRYDAKTNRVWSVAPDIDKRDSNGNLVTKQVFPPKAKTFTDEEFNASAVKHEDLIRRLLARERLPEQAIEEYFAGGFHLRPVDSAKINRIKEWCNKYITGYYKTLMMFTNVVVTGAEEQPPIVETTTVTVETTTVV